jgi:hypothetical protein
MSSTRTPTMRSKWSPGPVLRPTLTPFKVRSYEPASCGRLLDGTRRTLQSHPKLALLIRQLDVHRSLQLIDTRRGWINVPPRRPILAEPSDEIEGPRQ